MFWTSCVFEQFKGFQKTASAHDRNVSLVVAFVVRVVSNSLPILYISREIIKSLRGLLLKFDKWKHLEREETIFIPNPIDINIRYSLEVVASETVAYDR